MHTLTNKILNLTDQIFRFCAIPIAWIYGLAVYLRGLVWKFKIRTPFGLNGFVISVGNLEVGGTGKSPVVISLCQNLINNGKYPIILTRGYGAGFKRNDFMILINGKKIVESRPGLSMPDEATMQSLVLPDTPLVIGSNRFRSAQVCLRYFKQHSIPMEFPYWVLDDGFQHWSLKRHLDIVLLYGGDGHSRLDDYHLLPRGRLREPPSALKRASVVLVMRPGAGTVKSQLMDILTPWVRTAAQNPDLPVYPVQVVAKPLGECLGPDESIGSGKATVDGEGATFDPLHHCPALLVCGIARPEVFFEDFSNLYCHVVKTPIASTLAVGDHQPIDKKYLESHLNQGSAGTNPSERPKSIVTTAKDFARDPKVFRAVARDYNILVFVLEIEIEDAKSLWQQVLKTL